MNRYGERWTKWRLIRELNKRDEEIVEELSSVPKVNEDENITGTWGFPNEGVRVGSDFGWRDITGEVLTRGVGATDPAWTQIGSGPFSAYAFALNDQCWMSYHVPHDIVPGTDIFFHTHWISDGTSTNSVKWEYTYTFAKGFNQASFDPNGTTVSAEEAPPGVAYRHMVTETQAVSIPELTEPDGIIYVNITRITNGGSDNGDSIFMLTSDVHYQSHSMATVNKAPNFYG